MGRQASKASKCNVERARNAVTCSYCGQDAPTNCHGKLLLSWSEPWGHRDQRGEPCPVVVRKRVEA